MNGRQRLAFPLDYPNLDAARAAAALVRESVSVLKVGLELFVREGARAIAIGRELGCDTFLDLKLHDIPATVEAAVASAVAPGVRYLTIHASGGPRMVEAAVRRAERESTELTILAVTLLTSLGDGDLRQLGVSGTAAEHSLRLAKMAFEAGARGFVCSPLEVRRLRHELGPEAILVTPGIRPVAAQDDQKRTATPGQAIADGADLLVVGRPIREAPDPAAAARAVVAEIEAASR